MAAYNFMMIFCNFRAHCFIYLLGCCARASKIVAFYFHLPVSITVLLNANSTLLCYFVILMCAAEALW